MKLGGLTSEKDKKELFTSYLPKRKKDNWRSMKAYTDDSVKYEDFLKKIYNIYPEIKTDKAGTIDTLRKVCQRFKKISVKDEGELKRFGVEFYAEVQKLTKGKALITNQMACEFYYSTLEDSFVKELKRNIRQSVTLRSQFRDPAAEGADD